MRLIAIVLIALMANGCSLLSREALDIGQVGAIRFTNIQCSNGVTTTNKYIINSDTVRNALKMANTDDSAKQLRLVHGLAHGQIEYGGKFLELSFMSEKIAAPTVIINIGRPISQTLILTEAAAREFLQGIQGEQNAEQEAGVVRETRDGTRAPQP